VERIFIIADVPNPRDRLEVVFPPPVLQRDPCEMTKAINAKADDIGRRAFVEPGIFRLFLECP